MPAMRYTKGRLTAALQEVYRAERSSVVTGIYVVNTDTSVRTFDLQHVPADESTSLDHSLFYNNQIRAKTTQIIDTPIFLETGDTIHALASVTNVVALTLYVLDYASFLSRRTV